VYVTVKGSAAFMAAADPVLGEAPNDIDLDICAPTAAAWRVGVRVLGQVATQQLYASAEASPMCLTWLFRADGGARVVKMQLLLRFSPMAIGHTLGYDVAATGVVLVLLRGGRVKALAGPGFLFYARYGFVLVPAGKWTHARCEIK
jgi:hypothetical protein